MENPFKNYFEPKKTEIKNLPSDLDNVAKIVEHDEAQKQKGMSRRNFLKGAIATGLTMSVIDVLKNFQEQDDAVTRQAGINQLIEALKKQPLTDKELADLFKAEALTPAEQEQILGALKDQPSRMTEPGEEADEVQEVVPNLTANQKNKLDI